MATEVIAVYGTDNTPVTDKPRKVDSTVSYFKVPADGSSPQGTREETENQPIERRPYDTRHVEIEDVTDNEAKFELDKQGFQWHRHQTQVADLSVFKNNGKIREHYYPETERLLRDITGAVRTHTFEHRVRGMHNDRGWFGPEPGVHVDVSYDGAVLELRRALPDEAEELLQHRFQIINLWRPLGSPVLQHPLAVCDARTVPEEDLIAFPILRNGARYAEFFTVKYGDSHRWYYKHEQHPDEVLVMKQFDSDTSVARRVVHASFVDSDCGVGKNWNRRSIESVVMLFYEN